MTRSMIRLVFALCLTAIAFVRVAHADDGERAAKKHYERGQKLFNLQKFDEALEQFQKAYDAKPISDFMFNIAQCQRNLGEYEAAVFSYKKYLKLDPEASNRELVERLIEDLEQKIAETDTERLQLGKRKKPRPEEPPPKETGDRPVYAKWWFWTGVALVGAGAGVGIYFATKAGGTPETDFGNTVFPK